MQHLPDLARPYWPLILAVVIWPLVGAALSWWLWWDTPEHWEAYAKAHPGRALAIRALRTVSPHLRKLVVAWQAYAAARSSLPPLSVIAEKQGALDVSATRPSGLAHPAQIFAPQIVPPAPTPAEGADPADEDAHASIVPPAPFDPHRTMRGATSLSAAIVAVALLGIVAAVGAMVMGCPASQQLTRPALGAVDGCEPRSTRCAPDGRPQVCSGSRRWTDADVACVTAHQVAAVCCLTTSPITGRELHACVLAERCIASDGGL